MTDQFRQWLTSEMEKRHYSHGALAKAIGISRPFVSRVLSGEKAPSVDFCNKLALAFGEPPEKVFRLAGILPTTPNSDDPTLGELHDLVENLPLAQRKEALRYLRYLHQIGADEK